jgi:hypothetical protein
MAHASRIELPSWYRRRALADLDQLIAQAEGRLRQHHLFVERLAAAGKRTSRQARLLQVTRDRLALLHQSRKVLLSGEPPHQPNQGG